MAYPNKDADRKKRRMHDKSFCQSQIPSQMSFFNLNLDLHLSLDTATDEPLHLQVQEDFVLAEFVRYTSPAQFDVGKGRH